MKKRFSAIILFLLSISILAKSQNLDIDILKSINKTETSFKNSYSDFCEASVYPLTIGVPVTSFATGLITHDKKLQRDGLFMTGAAIVSAILVQGIKITVDRPRPYEEYSFIVKRDDNVSNGKSFPSGHATLAFCTATSLSLRYPKWYVIAPSYLWAGSVAWARMYQGVHYPSDVFTGAIIGTGTAWLAYYLQKKYETRNNKDKVKSVKF